MVDVNPAARVNQGQPRICMAVVVTMPRHNHMVSTMINMLT